MKVYDLVLVQAVFVLGFYLMIVGSVGILTGTPLVYQRPHALNRPTLYLLIVGLLFFEKVFQWFGPVGAYTLFTIVLVDLVFETLRPFFTPAIELVGATRENVNADVQHVLKKLGIRYRGRYPSYDLLDQGAKLRIKYWKKFGQGELQITPASQKQLLMKIQDEMTKNFDSEEHSRVARGFIVDLIVGALLFGLGIWHYGLKIF